MIDFDKWQEIFTSLAQHKLRTTLTAFGVFWGIFMLTVLLGAGTGLRNGVMDGFPASPNNIFIWSGSTTQLPYKGLPIGRRATLKPDDVAAIKRDVPSVAEVYGQNSIGVWSGTPPYTVHKNNSGTFFVQGAHAGMAPIHSVTVTEGRYLNAIDDRQKRKVAVIGARVKEQLFDPGEPVIGADIRVAGINFQVIGTFDSQQRGNNSQDEEKIHIPNDTLRHAFNQSGWIGSFVIQPKPGIHASEVEQQVKQYLHQRKDVHPDDVGVFGSFNLQVEYDKIQGLFTGINFFSWLVAVGTITAGAIGVGNIMLIVVKERTREIGVRKALGATPSSIVSMIVQESVVITAVAGYFGLVVGVLLLAGVSSVLEATGGSDMFARPAVDFTTALIAVLVLIVSGVLASLLPAAKAAAVNPIIALQDE